MKNWSRVFKEQWQIAVELVLLVCGAYARFISPVPKELKAQQLTSIGDFSGWMMLLGFLIFSPLFTQYNKASHVKYWNLAAVISFGAAVVVFMAYQDDLSNHLYTWCPPNGSPRVVLIGDDLTWPVRDRVLTERSRRLQAYANPKTQAEMTIYPIMRQEIVRLAAQDPFTPLSLDEVLSTIKDPANIWTRRSQIRIADQLDRLYLAFTSIATFASMFAVQAIASLSRKSV